jgi:hypothetical protein
VTPLLLYHISVLFSFSSGRGGGASQGKRAGGHRHNRVRQRLPAVYFCDIIRIDQLPPACFCNIIRRYTNTWCTAAPPCSPGDDPSSGRCCAFSYTISARRVSQTEFKVEETISNPFAEYSLRCVLPFNIVTLCRYSNGTVKLINHNRHGIRIVIHQVLLLLSPTNPQPLSSPIIDLLPLTRVTSDGPGVRRRCAGAQR